MRLCIALSLLLAGVAPGATCPTCRGRGVIPIRQDATYERARQAHERVHLWCNYCEALGLYDPEVTRSPCPDCNQLPDPSVKEAVSRERRETLAIPMQQWWSSHDSHLVIFMISDTFTVAADLREMPLKSSAREFARCRQRLTEFVPGRQIGRGKTLSRHERAHLWLQRMQDAWQLCSRLVGLDDAEAVTEFMQSDYRLNLMLFADGMSFGGFRQCYAPLPRRGTENHIAAQLGTSIGSDDLGWSRCLHDLAFHWVDRAFGSTEEDRIPGWLFHGLACHLELHFLGAVRFDLPRDREDEGSWGGQTRFRNLLHKRLDQDRLDLDKALQVTVGQADLDDKMIGWSLVEFLSGTDPARFGALVRGLIAEQPFADALQASHGWTLEELRTRWTTHIRKHYRASEKKRDPLRE
jgi:hypothetical protein